MPQPTIAVSCRLPPELYQQIEAARLAQNVVPKKNDWLIHMLKRGLFARTPGVRRPASEEP